MSGRKGKLSFTMDLNVDPIWINHTASRPKFFLGNRYKERDVVAKKVLWGSIVEEKEPEIQKSCLIKFGKNCDKI